MGTDWLDLSDRGVDSPTVLERLMRSPFDELVEIDFINDMCRNLCHAEGKYHVPVYSGSWSEIYEYSLTHMVHPDDREAYAAMLDPNVLARRMASSPTPGALSVEWRCRTVEGKWMWVRQVAVYGARNGLPEGLLKCFIYDIDNQKRREMGLVPFGISPTYGFQRDDVTALLVDRDFFTAAQSMLPTLSGEWCVVAVDIENFKLFCDWHGQRVGQFLLAEIGQLLGRVAQECGGLAGYRGQDDFELMIPYDRTRIEALLEELQKLIENRGNSVGFMPMFGICMIDGADEEIRDVYNHAALCAEQLKGDFKNRIRVYNPDIRKKNTEEYQVLSEFQRALDNNEIFFCLQPQCRVSTGKIVGAESLARWRTARGRMIPPTRFVPILEKHGMITNLDKFIWEGVCAWLRKWIDEGHTPVPISVNVSQIDVFTLDVPDHFDILLEKYRLPSDLIKIEITESAYVEDADVVRNTVARLRERGFVVLMDDFGSGYSSLNMLRSLNVDVIKLDAQFLRISENDSRKGVGILESIINMAKTMTIPVIVEGVETQEQSNFLADLGCRYMQGYYFYRPMPVEEFENLIRDDRQIDPGGVEFKANEEFHTREFLDENLFSDVMLNNILGPVAIYRWNGDVVDIIRYNQQFYQMVGIELHQLEERRTNMLRFFFPDDRERFLRALEHASRDRLNGARCVMRVYKPNGALCWIAIQLYFMEDNEQGTHFFGACQDVTEMQYVNQEIPGGYYRCSADERYEFLYISKGFENLVGYSAAEIREKFDNRLVNMVHRDDLEILTQRAEALSAGESVPNKPYRLKCRDGTIYVMTQSRLTELNGQVCCQCVAVDVNEVVKLRNQMRLLSRFSSDDVVFVRRKENAWKYRVVVHGLEAKMGMTAKDFEKLLNSDELYRDLDPEEAGRLAGMTTEALEENKPVEFEFTLKTPDGQPLRLHLKTDVVSDRASKVEYICTFREA